MAVRYARENNSYYPLPANYPQLSPDDQRSARLNALSLQETPEDLVIAWAFFREYYLKPKESGWYKRFKESPPLHYKMVEDIGRHSLVAWAAPRSFAKTTVVREIAMLLLLTRPNFYVALVQATDRKARRSLDRMKRAFEYNKLLLADFGELKPARGTRQWSTEALTLPNGATIEGLSVRGALRGERPDLILVDDPEYDEDATADAMSIEEDFEILLFKVLLPMLDEGAGLFWIGTRISRRSFLWSITEGDDPRFKAWVRRVISIEMPDGTSAWEAKWDNAARQDLLDKVGLTAYNSEYMNMPGSGAERLLSIHPEFCTYTIEGTFHQEAHPRLSTATLHYRKPVRAEKSIVGVDQQFPAGAWVDSLFKIILVDHARVVKKTADESCVLCLGFDSDDTLWVLDGFLGRVRKEELIHLIFNMAMRWEVRIIGSESVSVEEETTNQMAAELSFLGSRSGWIPRVVPIRYTKYERGKPMGANQRSKEDRIASMEWRFNNYRVRFPWHRRDEYAIQQLIFQVENFTMDLSLLRHDDAVDTLAMHQQIVRRKGSILNAKTPVVRSFNEMAESGEVIDSQTGIPLMATMGGVQSLTLDQVNILLARSRHVDEAEADPEEDRLLQQLMGAPYG